MSAKPPVTNDFGSGWTIIKLEALSKYLPAYTTALKNQAFKLLYIDAFAGTGACNVTMKGNKVTIEGSAKRALDTEPRFDELIFIEQKNAHCAALETLTEHYPGRSVRVIQGDANAEIIRLCGVTKWKKARAVLFLDPFGMDVAWTTLETVASTEAVDVWYLFPLSGVYRQMAICAADIDAAKTAALTRALGTDDWRTQLYEPPRIADLFDAGSDQRHADVSQITAFFTHRLRQLFPGVAGPKILYQRSESGGSQGSPLFALYFAAANPNPRAHAIACRIANHILGSL